jgi:hypothetical protein
VKV